jgi:hypothetical protein
VDVAGGLPIKTLFQRPKVVPQLGPVFGQRVKVDEGQCRLAEQRRHVVAVAAVTTILLCVKRDLGHFYWVFTFLNIYFWVLHL